MRMVLQNCQTTEPLVVHVDLVCNTSREAILGNVIANSLVRRQWVKTLPEHRGVAVICGSGPSLRESVTQVASRQLQGEIVFALNNCANVLAERGVLADYQVIMDARSETANLVGPATRHLFASQCDPTCFAKAPDAILWHATYGNEMVDEQPDFPQHDDDYCLIGGANSVGVTALALVYALGYREVHVYGMDSSNRGEMSHAVHQPMNDGEPCTITRFRGKEYVSSLTMKAQVESFMQRARRLKDCRIFVHGEGLLPDMWNAPPMAEEDKYKALWDTQDYRQVSPGEIVAQRFIQIASPRGKVIDFGCGTGRGGLAIMRQTNCEVVLLDFTENCRDPEAMSLPFVLADLTEPMAVTCDYAYCCDVLEHIPTDMVEETVSNILATCKKAFFQVSLVPDSMGSLIGEELHLTVKPYAWWLDLFNSLGRVLHSEDHGESAIYYLDHSKE